MQVSYQWCASCVSVLFFLHAVLGILNDVSKKVNGECRPHKQAPSRNISATGQSQSASTFVVEANCHSKGSMASCLYVTARVQGSIPRWPSIQNADQQ